MSDTAMHTALTAVVPSLGSTRPKARWRKATLANLSELEELLDALEREGYAEPRVTVVGEEFVVRWR